MDCLYQDGSSGMEVLMASEGKVRLEIKYCVS